MLKPENQLNLFKQDASAGNFSESREFDDKELIYNPDTGVIIYGGSKFIYNPKKDSIVEVFREGSPQKLDKSVLDNIKQQIKSQTEKKRKASGRPENAEECMVKNINEDIGRNWPGIVEIRGNEIAINIKGKKIVCEYRGGKSFIVKPLKSNVLEGEDGEHLEILRQVIKILSKQNEK